MRKNLVALMALIAMFVLGMTTAAFAVVPQAPTGLVASLDPDTGQYVLSWSNPTGATEIWVGVGDGIIPDTPPAVGEQPVWDAYLLSPDTTNTVLSLNPGIRDYNVAVWEVNASGSSPPARTVVQLRAPLPATNFVVNMVPNPDDTFTFTWSNPDRSNNVVLGMTDFNGFVPAEPPLDGSLPYSITVLDGSTTEYSESLLGLHKFVIWRNNDNGWSAPTTLVAYFPHLHPPVAASDPTWIYDELTSDWKVGWTDNNTSGDTTGVAVAISDGFDPMMPTHNGVNSDGSTGYLLEQDLDGNTALPSYVHIPFDQNYAWHDYRVTVWLRNDAGASEQITTSWPIPTPSEAASFAVIFTANTGKVTASWSNVDLLATSTVVAVSASPLAADSSPPAGAIRLTPDTTNWSTALTPGTWYVTIWRVNRTGQSSAVTATVSVIRPVYTTKVSISAAKSVVHRKIYYVKASISPSVATGTAKFVYQRKVGHSWRTYKTVNTKFSAGKSSSSYRPLVKGSWRVVVSYGGYTSTAKVYKSSSSIKTFAVR
jgi:hypothetical protein